MLGHIHMLGSYITINGSGNTFIKSTDAIDLRLSYPDQLGLYFKTHSYTLACVTPSHVVWYESSLFKDGPFAIAPGTNSHTVTNSTTQIINLSANYMPYIRLCAVNVSATPSSYFTAGIFYQED